MTNIINDRHTGIGGSDGAALFGKGYKTPLEVYLEKTQNITKEFSSSTLKVLKRGNILEPALRNFFENYYNAKIVTNENKIVHPEFNFIHGHVDGFVPADKAIIEFKTSSINAKKAIFGEELTDEVPDYYLIQAYHYLMINPSYEKVYMSVLQANDTVLQILSTVVEKYGINLEILKDLNIKLKLYQITKDEAKEKIMLDTYIKFWQNHVIPKIPPAPETFNDVKNIFRTAESGATVIATDEILQSIAAMQNIKAKLNDLEALYEEHKKLICNHMQNAEILLNAEGKKLATWKNMTSSRLDVTNFRNQYQELAAQFTKTSTTRIFRM